MEKVALPGLFKKKKNFARNPDLAFLYSEVVLEELPISQLNSLS
jgi:hypothetical protein